MRRPLPLPAPADEIEDLPIADRSGRLATTPTPPLSGDGAPTPELERVAPSSPHGWPHLEAILVATILLMTFALAAFSVYVLAR